MAHTPDPRSALTTHLGIEKPVSGAFVSAWADLLNDNYDLIDAGIYAAAAIPAIDACGAATNITTRNATTSAHGLVVKATAPASGLRNVVAIDNAETVYKNAALFDATTPAALGTAGPGTAMAAARRDHVHELPDFSGDYLPSTGTAENSDMLDGMHAAEFAEVAHTHEDGVIVSDADTVDGMHAAEFAEADLSNVSIPGEERGAILFHNGSGWTYLAHGTAGQSLLSGGHGADPYWG